MTSENIQKIESKDSQRPKKKYYRRPGKRYHNRSRYELKRFSFKKVSILIPLYNEEESLRPLISEVRNAIKKIDINYEIFFVDDGSTDDSLKIIKEFAKSDNKIRFISFRKNYGKSAALQLGFKNVSGDAVITMDADLQDDPAEIIISEMGHVTGITEDINGVLWVVGFVMSKLPKITMADLPEITVFDSDHKYDPRKDVPFYRPCVARIDPTNPNDLNVTAEPLIPEYSKNNELSLPLSVLWIGD